MSDLSEWIKKRRTIHDAAARGEWGTSSAERDALYNLPNLLTAVENVLELHKPFEHHGTTYCEHCSAVGEDEDYDWYTKHPCLTVRAIEGAIK